MQKTILFLATIFMIASGFVAFQNKEIASYTVDASESEVHWYAYKVTGKHDGTLAIKSGSLEMKDGVLIGGSFVMDMTTIEVTDIPKEKSGNAKLVGHLVSPDFFDVENHPESTFKIKSAKKTGKQAKNDKALEYEITGDLSIKGKTEEITFLAFVKEEGGKVMARTYKDDKKKRVKFDRSKFDIRYGSKSFFNNLGNKAIYNDVELAITLVANK